MAKSEAETAGACFASVEAEAEGSGTTDGAEAGADEGAGVDFLETHLFPRGEADGVDPGLKVAMAEVEPSDDGAMFGFVAVFGCEVLFERVGREGGRVAEAKDGAVVACRVDGKGVVVAAAAAGDEFWVFDEEADKVDKGVGDVDVGGGHFGAAGGGLFHLLYVPEAEDGAGELYEAL